MAVNNSLTSSRSIPIVSPYSVRFAAFHGLFLLVAKSSNPTGHVTRRRLERSQAQRRTLLGFLVSFIYKFRGAFLPLQQYLLLLLPAVERLVTFVPHHRPYSDLGVR